ncbi:hypothetical protein [Georgenia alba]|uniref:DUF397 domain-containing protein n=1 Tax=Georgenia alba TaxID=2233858 RepID=A0ABW2QCK2_9MICO
MRFGSESRHDGEDGNPSGPPTWRAGDLVAEAAPVRVGFRGRRSVTGVRLDARGWQAHLRVDELRAMISGRVGVVESHGDGPLLFLARVGAAAPDSIAAGQTAGLPPDAVALLPAKEGVPPAAVLDAEAFESFARWVETIPEHR